MSAHLLDDLVAAPGSGLPSICSAHPVVIEEALSQAAATDRVVLVEATCNQVNQEGGYTGQRPADFARQVRAYAARHGLAPGRLLLGGDHLGPNPWRHLPAAEALARSETMVADYVAAGFTKLHLDTSMACADDPPGPLAPETIAHRAARLAVVTEAAARGSGPDGASAAGLRYVLGTEVPVPGGESAGEHGIHVSTADDVRHTLDVSREALATAGVPGVWDRVRALVAQPGVEFSHAELFEYHPGQAAHLAACLFPGLVFEAHSTDYQARAALSALVADRFAVLKVGPGLTFAYREAVFALAAIEDELCGSRASGLRRVVDGVMTADPGHWQPFYPAEPAAAAYARAWSRSDRIRYYWPRRGVEEAVGRLLANLDRTGLPAELASQYLPWLAADEVPGVDLGTLRAADVPRAAVRRVLTIYDQATPQPWPG